MDQWWCSGDHLPSRWALWCVRIVACRRLTVVPNRWRALSLGRCNNRRWWSDGDRRGDHARRVGFRVNHTRYIGVGVGVYGCWVVIINPPDYPVRSSAPAADTVVPVATTPGCDVSFMKAMHVMIVMPGFGDGRSRETHTQAEHETSKKFLHVATLTNKIHSEYYINILLHTVMSLYKKCIQQA